MNELIEQLKILNETFKDLLYELKKITATQEFFKTIKQKGQ